jgi:Uma2 family endonuclease
LLRPQQPERERRPDCFAGIGADARAIRRRRLYLPWDAGKTPDFALEMASESDAENGIGEKRNLYESLGIGER